MTELLIVFKNNLGDIHEGRLIFYISLGIIIVELHRLRRPSACNTRLSNCVTAVGAVGPVEVTDDRHTLAGGTVISFYKENHQCYYNCKNRHKYRCKMK